MLQLAQASGSRGQARRPSNAVSVDEAAPLTAENRR
jgi:hypothetical protein